MKYGAILLSLLGFASIAYAGVTGYLVDQEYDGEFTTCIYSVNDTEVAVTYWGPVSCPMTAVF